MNEKIYLHTINNGSDGIYNSKRQLSVLTSILKDNMIKSLRLQGREAHPSFSGLDYISFSDYEKREVYNKEMKYYNGFQGYCRDGLSITFPHEKLKVIEPTIVEICSKDIYGYEKMFELGFSEDERYSDLPDEVQVKDFVKLDDMNGILFPTESFIDTKFFRTKKKKIELLKREISVIKELLYKYNHSDINIYDIDSLNEVNDEFIESKILLTKNK